LDYTAGNVQMPRGHLPSRNARGVSARILAEATPTETVSYLYGRDCLGEERDDEWLHYLHDAEGYVRQGADISGDVISAWLFDPDGQGNHVFGGFPCWKDRMARSVTSSAAGCAMGRRD